MVLESVSLFQTRTITAIGLLDEQTNQLLDYLL